MADENPAGTETLKGEDDIIYIQFPDVDGSFTTGSTEMLECQTTGSKEMSNDVQEVQSFKGDAASKWKRYIDGKLGWTMSVGFSKPKDPAKAAVQKKLLKKFMTGSTLVKVKMGVIGGTTEAPTFEGLEGYALIANISFDSPNDGEVTATASLTGTGELKETTTK